MRETSGFVCMISPTKATGVNVSFSSLFQKIKKLLKERPFFVLQRVLNIIPFTPFQVACFFQLKLEKFPSKRLRGFGSIREGTLGDVDAMSSLENKEKQIFIDRINNGEYCVVAIYNNEIVGYEWFSDKTNHLESRFQYDLIIPSDSIYAYDAFILPKYRLRGIWLLFKKFIFEKMKQIDRETVITMVDYGNDSSLKTHVRFGFAVYKKVFFLKIFKKSFFKEQSKDI